MPWPRRLAFAITLLTGAVIVVGCVALAVISPSGADIAWFGIATAIGLPSIVLGLMVARRRPNNPVGPLLTGLGLAPVVIAMTDFVQTRLAEGIWMWWYIPVALLALYFPDGRLPGSRWRAVALGLPAVAVAFGVIVAVDPAGGPLAFALLPVLFGLLVATAVSMVVRYRRADDVLRAQLKWFALAGLFLPATLLLCWTSYLLLRTPDLVVIGLVLTYLAVPAATAIAMLRHDLYDVDRALSVAVAYTLATTGLLAVFTAVSFASGLVLGRDSVAVAAATTALCAVALAPLRVRLQRQVDRRLYPVRRAALAALDDLRSRIHSGQSYPEQLEEVLGGALRDRSLRVGYRLPGGAELVDADGIPLRPGAEQLAPVRVGGVEIGALTRDGGGSRELLRELASASALLVEVVRLRIELAQALREVEASRGWSPSAWRCGWLSGTSRTAPSTWTDCSTRAWPSWAPRSPSCVSLPTVCGRAASTTGSGPLWQR